MRGRKPKPTHLKLLHGSRRPINKHEPKPKLERPPCPARLCPEAKKAWREIVPELERLGLLTTIDGQALARYCDMHAIYVEAMIFLKDNPKVYSLRDESGKLKCLVQVPQVAMARSFAKLANQLG